MSSSGSNRTELLNINVTINGRPMSMSGKSNSENGSDVYEVEKILTHRMVGGRKEYFIKWVGYPSNENTWEPESNILNQDINTIYQNELKKAKEKKIIKKSSEPERRDSKSKSSTPSAKQASDGYGIGKQMKKKQEGDSEDIYVFKDEGSDEVEKYKPTESKTGNKDDKGRKRTSSDATAAAGPAATKIKDVGLSEMFKQSRITREKNGFEKNYKIDYIVGMNKNELGEVSFLVKWKKDDLLDGDEEFEVLPTELVKEKAPIHVCLYYESIVTKVEQATESISDTDSDESE